MDKLDWHGTRRTLESLLIGTEHTFATKLSHGEKRMIAYAYQLGQRDMAAAFKFKAEEEEQESCDAMVYAQKGELLNDGL